MFSAFQLFINDFIIREIKMCTETKARSKLNDSWSLSEEEIYYLLAIMLAKRVISKGQPISFL